MSATLPSSQRIPAFPPVWAEVFGEDNFGIFAEFMVKEVRFVWRWIPPGRFLMGSTKEEEGKNDNEKSQHTMTLSRGSWLGETPVTQAQWQAVMGDNPSRFKGAPELPVEQVSWQDSMVFAGRINRLFPGFHATLPTEAQWEYACRAGTNSDFNDGSPCTQPDGLDSALDALGWFDENSGGKTHAVKEKKPNAWGLYDTHGNVWEWCADAWKPDGYSGRESGVMNPETVDEDENADRLVRGGSWYGPARSCRAAFRLRFVPDFRGFYLGLRLATGQEPGGAAEPQGAERPEQG